MKNEGKKYRVESVEKRLSSVPRGFVWTKKMKKYVCVANVSECMCVCVYVCVCVCEKKTRIVESADSFNN
jgi:hypothetical protein